MTVDAPRCVLSLALSVVAASLIAGCDSPATPLATAVADSADRTKVQAEQFVAVTRLTLSLSAQRLADAEMRVRAFETIVDGRRADYELSGNKVAASTMTMLDTRASKQMSDPRTQISLRRDLATQIRERYQNPSFDPEPFEEITKQMLNLTQDRSFSAQAKGLVEFVLNTRKSFEDAHQKAMNDMRATNDTAIEARRKTDVD